MANKLSDILQMIHNTQIRTAIEKLAGLCGLTSGSVTGGSLTANLTGDVTGAVTGDVAGILTGSAVIEGGTTNGITFEGAYTTHAINFDSVTLSTTLMGAGSYSTPVAQTCTTGFMNFASENTTPDAWNLGIGLYMKGNAPGVKTFPLCVQAEYNSSGGTNKMQCAQFIAVVGPTGYITTRDGDGTAGVFSTWHKVWMPDTAAVCQAGARVGAIWADLQIYNGRTSNCESAAMFVTNGGESIDAVFWIDQSNGYGFDYLFDFSNDQLGGGPQGFGPTDATKNSTGSIKIKIGATEYYIPYFNVAGLA